jgi:hypothetical protein
MTNPGPAGLFSYPGLKVTSESPGVTQKGSGGVPAFELAAGRSATAFATLQVDASLPHGTLVHLEASAATTARCRNVPTLDVPVVVP